MPNIIDETDYLYSKRKLLDLYKELEFTKRQFNTVKATVRHLERAIVVYEVQNGKVKSTSK